MFRNALVRTAIQKVLGGAVLAFAAWATPLAAEPPGLSPLPRLVLPEGACRPQPAVWLVEDADTRLFLFGTIHVRQGGKRWGGPVAEWALAQSDAVWTETDIADTSAGAALERLGMDPARRLSGNPDISEQNRTRLRRAAQSIGLPYESLDTMKPWLAGVTLSLAPIQRAGYDPAFGVDRAVYDVAKSANKEMRWFETGEAQFGFLNGLKPQLQLELMYQALDDLDKKPDALQQLEAAWEKGDDARLQHDLVDEVRDSSAELYNVLLAARNNAWSQRLEDELDTHVGAEFIAVGIAHLLGPDSVLERLRGSARTVDRLTPGPGNTICR